MNSESQQQQKIMVYFIEEAKDHLQTIEQGVLNLQEILVDPEAVTEMFRAAHSIKGGAAMLGIGGVQHISHRLEDYFKVLKDHTNIEVDEKLKSLLLGSFDRLQELIEQLHQNFRIPEDIAAAAIAEVEPVFLELGRHLQQLVEATGGIIEQEGFAEPISQQSEEQVVRDLVTVFQADINNRLRDMLQLFKQEEQFSTRQQLQNICNELCEIGEEFMLGDWCELIKAAAAAIANENNSYRTLAPVVIKDIKQAKDLILEQRADEISISLQLQDLLPVNISNLTESSDEIDLDILETDISEQVVEVEEEVESDSSDSEHLYELNDVAAEEFSWIEDQREGSGSTINGPEVGAQELKSLATLFENEDIDLESAWEDIESNETLISANSPNQALHEQEDFADLFADDDQLSSIASVSDIGDSSDDSLAELFGTNSLNVLNSNTSIIVEEPDSLFPVNILEDELSELLDAEQVTEIADASSSNELIDSIESDMLSESSLLSEEWTNSYLEESVSDAEDISNINAVDDDFLVQDISNNVEGFNISTNDDSYGNLDEEDSSEVPYDLNLNNNLEEPNRSVDHHSNQIEAENIFDLDELESDPFNLDSNSPLEPSINDDIDESLSQDPFAVIFEENLVESKVDSSIFHVDEDTHLENSSDDWESLAQANSSESITDLNNEEQSYFDVFTLKDPLVESDSLSFEIPEEESFVSGELASETESLFSNLLSDILSEENRAQVDEHNSTTDYFPNENLQESGSSDEDELEEYGSRTPEPLLSIEGGLDEIVDSSNIQEEQSIEIDSSNNIQDYLFEDDEEDSVSLLHSNSEIIEESTQEEFELVELGFDIEEGLEENDSTERVDLDIHLSSADEALNNYAELDEQFEASSNLNPLPDESFVFVSDFDTPSLSEEVIDYEDSLGLMSSPATSVNEVESPTLNDLNEVSLQLEQESLLDFEAQEQRFEDDQQIFLDTTEIDEDQIFIAVLNDPEHIIVSEPLVTEVNEVNTELEADEMDFEDFFVNSNLSESSSDDLDARDENLGIALTYISNLNDDIPSPELDIQSVFEFGSNDDSTIQEVSQDLDEDLVDFFSTHNEQSAEDTSIERELTDFFNPIGETQQFDSDFSDELISIDDVKSETDDEDELLQFFDAIDSGEDRLAIADLETQTTDEAVTSISSDSITENEPSSFSLIDDNIDDNDDLGFGDFFDGIEQTELDDVSLTNHPSEEMGEELLDLLTSKVNDTNNNNDAQVQEDDDVSSFFSSEENQSQQFGESDESEELSQFLSSPSESIEVSSQVNQAENLFFDPEDVSENTLAADESVEELPDYNFRLDVNENAVSDENIQGDNVERFILPTETQDSDLSELGSFLEETLNENLYSSPVQVNSTNDLEDFFSASLSNSTDASDISVTEISATSEETGEDNNEDLGLADFFAEVNLSNEGDNEVLEIVNNLDTEVINEDLISNVNVLDTIDDDANLSNLFDSVETLAVEDYSTEPDNLVNSSESVDIVHDSQDLLPIGDLSSENSFEVVNDEAESLDNTVIGIAEFSQPQQSEEFGLIDEELEVVSIAADQGFETSSEDILIEDDDVEDTDLENFFSNAIDESNLNEFSNIPSSDELSLADFLNEDSQELSAGNSDEIFATQVSESFNDNYANVNSLFTDSILDSQVQANVSNDLIPDFHHDDDQSFELSDDFSSENIEDNIASVNDYSWAEATDETNFLDLSDESILAESLENVTDESSVLPSASTTIDNLVDFFEGDDQSGFTQDEDTAIAENTFLQTPEESEQFSTFHPLSDFRVDNASSQVQPDSSISFDIDNMSEFDELEAMLSDPTDPSSLPSTYEKPQQQQSQVTDVSADSDFDELEALLGEVPSGGNAAPIPSQGFQSNVVKADRSSQEVAVKKNDEFDDLEVLLKETYGNDSAHINTKATKQRTPDKRKQNKIIQQVMKVDVKHLDSLNNLVGELVVNRNLLEQNEERLQQFISNLLHQVQQLSDVSQRMRDQYDRSLLENSLLATRRPTFNSDLSIEERLNNINEPASNIDSEFDALEMDRFSSFHSLSQEIIELIVRVRESADDIDFVVGETEQVSRQLGVITTQLQDDLKQSRMVPFAQLTDRLPRAVRELALKGGKQVDIEIFGRETLIDKAVLDELNTPMNHLITNAIAHGIEEPAIRQSSGKPAKGKITVRAYHQGNQTVISINDDGGGINVEKVKRSAISKGMLTSAEASKYTENETYDLLFEPGFSTKDQADETAGRGMGLDIVKTELSEIRGTIHTESALSKGTTFTIRLPLTLSISKAMFCISDRTRIAFPVDGFEDMMEVPQSQIQLNGKGQPCLPWRDTILPFQPLANLLAYSRHISRSNIYGKQDDDVISIIILRNEGNYLALQVDQFLGESEIVIKQLEGPIPKPAGIAGATVLGDGRVMAIANVLELFDIASGRLRPAISPTPAIGPTEELELNDPTVLIVDDSITVRELLSLTFAKVGYRVEQARDGQDAWEKLRAGLPCNLIFCDIEMPRMDGLELLSRLQKDENLSKIPIAMLTSRGADRHRQTAVQLGASGYFTKPYLEEELLTASQKMLKGEVLVSNK